MEREIYLANPCKASSLPFWKTNAIAIPGNMKIVLEEDLGELLTEGYEGERYFKLIHFLKDVTNPLLDCEYELVCCDVTEYAAHIEACYEDVGISVEELERYRTHAVYEQSLWVAVAKRGENKIIASGIAEFDTDIKEGILEWIQVLPTYRGKGLGKFVVRELLWRMKDKADFVTVSGKMDNPTNPKALYKACGFEGEEVWHVLRESVLSG